MDQNTQSVKKDFRRAAFYAGSFSPVTYGHLDVIKHAAKMTDHLVIGVGTNPAKKPLFSAEERAEMIREDLRNYVQPELDRAGNPCTIEVVIYEGATSTYMRNNDISVYFRGIRGVKDFNDEESIAAINTDLFNDGDFSQDVQEQFTQVLIYSSSPDLRKVSSSAARELTALGEDHVLHRYISPDVFAKLLIRMDERGMRPLSDKKFEVISQSDFKALETLWTTLTQDSDPDIAKEIFQDLVIKYSQPHRTYHHLGHISQVLQDWDRHKGEFAKPNDAAFALFFHDCIYDPASDTNEVDSAAYAQDTLERLGFDKTRISNIVYMIERTKDHQVSDKTSDTALVLDIDMRVLALSGDRYTGYTNAIEAEYTSTYTPDEFYEGRLSKFINPLLDNSRIFITDTFEDKYGDKARTNLESEKDRIIRKLDGTPDNSRTSGPKPS